MGEVHEDVVLKDEEHMGEVDEKLEKLKTGSRSQSILNDLKKKK